jgi:hemoglobin-like flavoprotein
VTPEQVNLIRCSWPDAAARAHDIAAAFYARLFELDNSAARLFAGVDMRVQREKLMQALGVVVQSLDDPSRLLGTIAPMGRRHARYGVERQHFDSVGQALIGAFGDVHGDAFSAEHREAWAAAYALVASVMQRAIDKDRRTTMPELERPVD